MKKNEIIFRWVALLPGAVIAGLISTFPLHWLLYLKFARNGTFLGFIELPPGINNQIEYTIYPFVISLTYILVGYKIAPMYKLKTSIWLASLYLFFMLVVFFFAKINNLPISFGVRFLGPFLGLILGLYIIKLKTRINKKV